MRLLVAILLIGCSGVSAQDSSPFKDGVVVVRDGDGRIQGAFVPRAEPYTAARCCPLKAPVLPSGAVDLKGTVITGFGYYAWVERGVVRVQIVELVPKPGAPNRYLWATEPDKLLLQPRAFDSMSLPFGRSIPVGEMKKLKIPPAILSLEKEPPKR